MGIIIFGYVDLTSPDRCCGYVSHDKAVRELKEKIVGVDPSVAKLELQQAELLSKFTVLENKVSENGDAVRIVKVMWEDGGSIPGGGEFSINYYFLT